MIRNRVENAERLLHDLSGRDRLYLILLFGAILRSIFNFTNYAANVYSMWPDYIFTTWSLPYPDHPPVFFLIGGVFQVAAEILQGLNPALYPLIFIAPFYMIYRYTQDKSPYLFALLAYVLAYLSVIFSLGNSLETMALVSFLSGLAFIYMAYRLGVIVSESVGIYAALFTAVGWWPIAYSSTALVDMYAASLMIVAYYLYYVLIHEESPSLSLFVLTTISLTAAMYAKYYAVILAPFIAIYTAYIYRDDIQTLTYRMLPVAVALLLFLPWVWHTDFYLLNHYAATHYLFIELPGLPAFASFLWKALTPFFFIVFIYGIKVSYEDIEKAIYFLIPVVGTLLFHVFQALVLGRSHSLINLTNYMLYSYPLIAVVAAIGWKRLITSERTAYLATALLAITMAAPIFMNPVITLEYDRGYTAPEQNLNTLDSPRFSSLDIPEGITATDHIVYELDRDLKIWSEQEEWVSHSRWESPTVFRTAATQPLWTSLRLTPLEPSNITLVRNGVVKSRFYLDEPRTVYLRSDVGDTVFRFESTIEVPFYAQEVECHRGRCPDKPG